MDSESGKREARRRGIVTADACNMTWLCNMTIPLQPLLAPQNREQCNKQPKSRDDLEDLQRVNQYKLYVYEPLIRL